MNVTVKTQAKRIRLIGNTPFFRRCIIAARNDETMDVFFEIHKGLPQEGPGSEASTMKALSLVPRLPRRPKILDVGCGPGRQTLILARETGGNITAVDNHQPYLDELERRAEERGFAERIVTKRCSMEDMSFDEGSFHLVWAEGSIYIMGFRNGLTAWRRFLKPDGALAVTEASWLVDSPPEDVKTFWQEAYPAMQTVAGNTEIIKESEYSLVDTFTLPESTWWDGYYTPMEKRIAELRRKYSNDPTIIETLDAEQKEIDLYRRHSGSYGYVFYVLRKSA
jgi:ubiquinone/menaquinone biosynthesis C-methylase UbiE